MVKNKRHDIVKLSKFKTSICTYFDTPSGCPFGDRCAFAHGEEELREEATIDSLPNDCSLKHEGSDGGAGTAAADKKIKGPATANAPPAQPRSPDSGGKEHSKTISEGAPLTPLLVSPSTISPIGAQFDNSNDNKDIDNRSGGTKILPTTAGGAPPRHHREGGRKKPSLSHLDPSTTAAGAPLHPQGLLPISPGMVPCMMPYYGATNSPVAMYIPYSSIQHPYFNINNHSYVNVVMDGSSAIEPPNYSMQMMPSHIFSPQSVHGFHQDGHHLSSNVSMVNARPWHPPTEPVHSTAPGSQADGYLDALAHDVAAGPKGSCEGYGAAPAPIFSEIDMMTSTKGTYPLKTDLKKSAYLATHANSPGCGTTTPALTLQSLMSSTTPPTIVHIPFGSAMTYDQCGAGGVPTSGSLPLGANEIDPVPPLATAAINSVSIDGTAWTQGYPTHLPENNSRGWGGCMVLPNSDTIDVASLQALSTPQTSCDATPLLTNFQDFLQTVTQDEDECMDLNRFLAQWGQFVTTPEENGQESVFNISRPKTDELVPKTDSAVKPTTSGLHHITDPVAPANISTVVADALKEPIQITASHSVASALQPPVPLKERDDALLPTGLSATPTSERAKKSTAPPPRRPGLVCSMFCEKTLPSKENVRAEKDTSARVVRRPVMKNCFASSCSTKGIASERPNCILLYNVEKNTVYYITAPCCLEKNRFKDDVPASNIESNASHKSPCVASKQIVQGNTELMEDCTTYKSHHIL